jgi:hypothetical protein
MQQYLDRIILSFPVLFLKQYPYAWIAVVALWPRSPVIVLICLAIIGVGLLCLRWQSTAWVSHMRRLYAANDGKFYIDQPPIPWQRAARSIAVLTAGSAVFAYLLRGQFGLSFWQFLLMGVGFTLLYRDAQFFGTAVTYIITATGIGIHLVPGHLDYRLFLSFKEISRIERCAYQEKLDTDIFARTRDAGDGLLLIPKDPNGFTKQIDKLFIVPQDVDRFVEQLPYGFGKA